MPRLPVLSLIILALAVLATAPAPADALTRKQIFGIGDLHAPGMLKAKRLLRLKPRSTRILADWNVARTDGWERTRVDRWYAAARAARVKPLLAFQGFNRHRAPSVARYARAARAAMRRWPRIKEWQAWNEANHRSQPVTYNHPRRAARYARALERVRCRGCTIVPITLVASNSPRTRRWIARFLRVYGKTPRIWALHTYGDVNRFSNTRLATFLGLHPRGRIWITETGGFARYDRGWRYSLKRQRRATRFAFRQAVRFRSRVDRLYWWEWRGQRHPRRAHWDSGLVDHRGKPRPAYRAARNQRFVRH